MNPKQIAGEASMKWVQPGMTLGLGTGSTSYFAITALGKRVREGLEVVGAATSEETARIATEEGIPMKTVEEIDQLDLYIDGADEVDPRGNLIKGGGGALFREKRLASLAATRIVIVHEAKLVSMLGKFPLPVEVVPFGWKHVARQMSEAGYQPVLRKQADAPYLTDNGNYILDCQLGQIPEPAHLHAELKQMIGVVETGLFIELAERVVVGFASGECRIFDPKQEAVQL